MLRRLPVQTVLLLLAFLQGLAPLLHDHLGGPQAGRAGIHAHFGLSDVGQTPVTAADKRHASSEEFPDVGVGQLIERRIPIGVSPTQTVLPAPPVVYAVADAPALRVAQLVAAAPPPPAARSLPPPALAPPIPLA